MSALHDSRQAALAAEHRAVFGYALLGPRLSGSDRAFAVACSDAHETVRDATAGAIAAAGLTPVGPAADYPALYPVVDAAAARRIAVGLEEFAAAAWRFLYATAAAGSAGPARQVRPEAQRQLTACAVRAAQWRSIVDPARSTTPFPGI